MITVESLCCIYKIVGKQLAYSRRKGGIVVVVRGCGLSKVARGECKPTYLRGSWGGGQFC